MLPHEFCQAMARKAVQRAEEAAPAEQRAWHDVARSWRALGNSAFQEGGDPLDDLPPPAGSPRH